MSITRVFGPNLKLLRSLKRRSQDIVAAALEVKRSTYAGWENGASEPSLHNLLMLGEYYQINLNTLLTIDLSEQRPSEIEAMQRDY